MDKKNARELGDQLAALGNRLLDFEKQQGEKERPELISLEPYVRLQRSFMDIGPWGRAICRYEDSCSNRCSGRRNNFGYSKSQKPYPC